MPSVRLRHPLRFGRARILDVHNVGRREGSAGRLVGALEHVQRPVGLALYGELIPGELQGYARLHIEGQFLR